MTRQTQLCRDYVREKFPWAMQSGQKMVVGTDLDSILSSAFAHHYKGWELVGFYNLENVYTSVPIQDLRAAVWLDLDISRPNIKSIGHHILLLDDTPIPQHANSLNPNLLRNVTHSRFNCKYPLATFHFLCWLWGITPPVDGNLSLALYWLPDSAFINAQSNTDQKRHYRPNVCEWVECMNISFLKCSLDLIDTKEFEESVKQLTDQFQQLGWSVEPGQACSNHLNLTGAQCRFENPDKQKLDALYGLIAQITGWQKATCPESFSEIRGRRKLDDIKNQVSDMTNEALSRFLTDRRVFSYAFPSKRKINYTCLKEDPFL